jgi:hypothetical protein
LDHLTRSKGHILLVFEGRIHVKKLVIRTSSLRRPKVAVLSEGRSFAICHGPREEESEEGTWQSQEPKWRHRSVASKR